MPQHRRTAAIDQTDDYDAALLQVYGVEQHGMDTAWRLSLGLDPLPSPEELESRVSESREPAAADATPAPDTSPAESDAPGDATPEPPAATSAPVAAQEAADDGDTADGPSSGCSAPPGGAASAGLGTLALLAGPLGLGALPFLRCRPAGSSSGSGD